MAIAEFYVSMSDGMYSQYLEGEKERLVQFYEAQRLVLRQVPTNPDDLQISPSYYSSELGISIDSARYVNRKMGHTIDDSGQVILKTFEFPYGPQRINYGGNQLAYTEVARPALKPLLRATNPINRKITFNALLADRASHGLVSIDDQLETLKEIGMEDVDLLMQYGGVVVPYHLRMTGLGVTSKQITPGALITQATVAIELTEIEPLNTEIVHLQAVLYEPPLEDGDDDDGESGPEMDDSATHANRDPMATLIDSKIVNPADQVYLN
mgnify:CR=1 FL=1